MCTCNAGRAAFCGYLLPSLSLSLTDEVLSENFLDYKSRGVSGSHKGQVVWRIDASVCFMEGQCSSVSSIEVASGFGLSLFLCVSLMLPETQRTLSEPPQMRSSSLRCISAAG